MNNKYSDNLVNESISPDVLAMLDKDIMEKRFMMPLSYDKDSHTLTVVTSHFEDNFMDMSIILALVRKNYSDIERIDFLSCDYNNFTAGVNAHYKQQLLRKSVIHLLPVSRPEKVRKSCRKVLL